MCHLVLALPILGLALFYFLPLSQAAPLYAVDLFLSLGVYFLMIQSMHRPVVSGREGMIGESAEALEDFDSRGRVSYGAEIWNALTSGPIRKGQRVRITAVRGLWLSVSAESPPEDGRVSPVGAGQGEKG